MRQHGSAFVRAVTVALLLVPPALGGDQSRLAIIDRTAIEDFPFQGEYVGKVKAGENPRETRHFGLQVVSLGQRKFQGVEYVGGLPGAGWDGAPPRRLEGTRQGNKLRLADKQASYVVMGQRVRAMRGEQRIGQLRKVERVSPTLGAPPPPEALVLFDGTSTEHFQNGQLTEDGLLMEGPVVNPLFHDFSLHLEFLLPYMPYARGQGRSNSGVYLQTRYEVQVLDSFGLPGKSNECGGLYRFRPPEVNACFPPLTWQTYDIDFSSPRWNTDGSKRVNARITVRHNGVLIHDRVELANKTGAGADENPALLPIRLQDHQNPVRYRNIWIVDRGLLPAKEPPPEKQPTDDAPKQPTNNEVAPEQSPGKNAAPEQPTGKDAAPKEPPGKDAAPKQPPAKDAAPKQPPGKDAAPKEPTGKDAAPEQRPSDKPDKKGNDPAEKDAPSAKERRVGSERR